MARISHKTVNMQWDTFTAEEIKNINPEAVAMMLNKYAKDKALAEFANGVLERLINAKTGMDSIELAMEIDNRDLIAESME